MTSFASLKRDWLANPRADILAGIVVALALIPEAISFSIIAGVDPRVGLYASFSIAVTTALVGGRPGMISAATAAIAVLVLPLIRDHGVEYLFAATILMGVIQVIAGFLRLDMLMQGSFAARTDSIGKSRGRQLMVSVTAAPKLGRATDHMVRFLAGEFGVSISAISVVYGRMSVNTQLRIKAPARLPAALQQLPLL